MPKKKQTKTTKKTTTKPFTIKIDGEGISVDVKVEGKGGAAAQAIAQALAALRAPSPEDAPLGFSVEQYDLNTEDGRTQYRAWLNKIVLDLMPGLETSHLDELLGLLRTESARRHDVHVDINNINDQPPSTESSAS